MRAPTYTSTRGGGPASGNDGDARIECSRLLSSGIFTGDKRTVDRHHDDHDNDHDNAGSACEYGARQHDVNDERGRCTPVSGAAATCADVQYPRRDGRADRGQSGRFGTEHVVPRWYARLPVHLRIFARSSEHIAQPLERSRPQPSTAEVWRGKSCPTTCPTTRAVRGRRRPSGVVIFPGQIVVCRPAPSGSCV